MLHLRGAGLTAGRAKRDIGGMPWREVVIWIGGGLLIAAAVVGYLWWTAPEDDVLPRTYQYGVR